MDSSALCWNFAHWRIPEDVILPPEIGRASSALWLSAESACPGRGGNNSALTLIDNPLLCQPGAACGKTALRPERQNTLTRPSGRQLQLQPATTFLFSRTDRALFLHTGIRGHWDELWASSHRSSMIDLPPIASTAQPTKVSPQRPLPMHPGPPLPATHRRRMDHSSSSTSILTLYVCTPYY